MNERLGLLKQRHAVRSYTSEPLPKDAVNKLRAEISMTNSHESGLRFQLVFDDPEPLAGWSRGYGVFSNPRNFMVAVVDKAAADVWERAGYFAERFAIKAVSLGLGTCFVSGTFDRDKIPAQLRAGETIAFIVLFGCPAEKTRPVGKLMAKIAHIKSMKAEDFFEPRSQLAEAGASHHDLRDGLEAVACAPSAMNRRPVRLYTDERNQVRAKVDGDKRDLLIDLGIAKFNYNYATETECEWGNGAPLEIQDDIFP